jgi:hypothetical protein
VRVEGAASGLHAGTHRLHLADALLHVQVLNAEGAIPAVERVRLGEVALRDEKGVEDGEAA